MKIDNTNSQSTRQIATTPPLPRKITLNVLVTRKKIPLVTFRNCTNVQVIEGEVQNFPPTK